MPHTKCKEVYFFDELDEKAKEKARDWYREGPFDYELWDSDFEAAVTAGKLLGIELASHRVPGMDGKFNTHPTIYFSGFASQGDGACFEGVWRASGMKTLRALQAEFGTDKELYRIHRELRAVTRKHPEAATWVKHTGRYAHEHSVSYTHEFGSHEDRPNLKEGEETIEEALRDFMRWIYRGLETEWDYLNADEQVDDTIRANDYEFSAEGRRA